MERALRRVVSPRKDESQGAQRLRRDRGPSSLRKAAVEGLGGTDGVEDEVDREERRTTVYSTMGSLKSAEVVILGATQAKDEILRRLRQLKPEVAEEFGVRSLSVFGSVVREEHTEAIDIDLLVEFEGVPTLFEMARLQARLEDELDASVDLVTPGGLRPRTLARAREDSVAV